MNAWATSIISGLVLIVAFMQWRTNHQKLMLDLFEKRLAVYKSLRDAFNDIHRDGTVKDRAVLNKFHQISSDARFLFGEDFRNLINEIIRHAAIMNTDYSVYRNNPDSSDAKEWGEKSHASLIRMIEIYDILPEMAEAYLWMAQKRMRTTKEYFLKFLHVFIF